jgi:nitrite reductase (cytochrome c-552)
LRLIAALTVAVMLVAAGTTALLVNIFARKQEARDPLFRVVEVNETIDGPAVRGKSFPQQYELYLRTVDQARARFGGSEAVPRTRIPSKATPCREADSLATPGTRPWDNRPCPRP